MSKIELIIKWNWLWRRFRSSGAILELIAGGASALDCYFVVFLLSFVTLCLTFFSFFMWDPYHPSDIPIY